MLKYMLQKNVASFFTMMQLSIVRNHPKAMQNCIPPAIDCIHSLNRCIWFVVDAGIHSHISSAKVVWFAITRIILRAPIIPPLLSSEKQTSCAWYHNTYKAWRLSPPILASCCARSFGFPRTGFPLPNRRGINVWCMSIIPPTFITKPTPARGTCLAKNEAKHRLFSCTTRGGAQSESA